ncbi:MAG: NDP-sugar synthase [Phycisphaerales bacterium]|nr:NDP-sugar synthase [Phycisphaerales bacterium]
MDFAKHLNCNSLCASVGSASLWVEMDGMNAVVLAGGVRSGLEVPGSGLPRALWPFPGEPLISHVLRFLVRSGCRNIAICANGKTRMIASELSSGEAPWQSLHYSEDILPRGPAGCLRDLRAWTGTTTMVCIQGTGWYDFDLSAMMEEHRRNDAAITVGALRAGKNHLEPAGVYLIEPRTLDLVPPVGYHDIKEQFIPHVIAVGMRVRCHKLRGPHPSAPGLPPSARGAVDRNADTEAPSLQNPRQSRGLTPPAMLIHSPEHYLAAMREAIPRAAADPPAGFRSSRFSVPTEQSHVVIHETATVSPNAYLRGNIWIDAGAVIEQGAVLLGPIVISTRAVVGADSLVRRSVALRDAFIPPGSEAFSRILSPATTKARRREETKITKKN